MSEIFIFCVFILIVGFCCIWAYIDEKIEKIHRERNRQRREFLKSHPNYGIDYAGNIVKIR